MTCDRQYRRTSKERPPPRPCTGKTARPGGGGTLIADREALADMGRPLDLVGERDRVIREGNTAFAVGSHQKLVSRAGTCRSARPRRTGPRGTGGPVQLLFLP